MENTLLTCIDADGDGYPIEFDCDDNNIDIHQVRHYLDTDGDGQGDIREWIHSCIEVEGYVQNGDDWMIQILLHTWIWMEME